MPPRSRQTRNQDASSRARQGQIIDLDPTDGLPVQKYALQKIQINQDASADATSTNTKSTNSAEWEAQFRTPQFPWPEQNRPSFLRELPTWNQEMIRRARAGNTNAKLSVWDRKNNTWMSAAEAGKKATPLKSLHLNNLDPASNTNDKLLNGADGADDADSTKSHDDSAAEDSSNESSKSADEDEEDEVAAPFKAVTSSAKRRKLTSRLHGPGETRIIELKKWVHLPPALAEKTPDRSFLAVRRPGMPPLYNPEYAQKIFGRYHSSSTISGSAGYDIGEGGGLNNASGVLGATGDNTAGTATPTRKNMPPRRKKKKLGGPGRKPKHLTNPQPPAEGVIVGTAVPGETGVDGHGTTHDTMDGVIVPDDPEARGDAAVDAGTVKPEAGEGEGDGHENEIENDESGSEAEGSEEGEIDETGGVGGHTTHAAEDTTKEETTTEHLVDTATIPAIPPSTVETMISDTEMPDVFPESDPVPAVVPLIEPEPIAMPAETESALEIPGIAPVLEEDKTPEPEPEPEPELETEPELILAPDLDPIIPTPAPTGEVLIPGLGSVADPEEKQIVGEISEAISTPGIEITDAEIAAPTSDLLLVDDVLTATQTQDATTPDTAAVTRDTELEEIVNAEEEPKKDNLVEPVDLLGAMDAAIDQGMGEGEDAL